MTDAPNIRRGLVTCGVAFVAIAALYLGLLGLASRGQPSFADGYDGIGFVLAISEFDLARFQPHPPGFPVFVLLGRALHALLPITPSVAVASVSAIFLSAGLSAIAGVLAAQAGRYAAALFVLLTAPHTLLGGLGVATLSDGAGLGAGLLYLALLAFCLHQPSRALAVLCGLCGGLALGIRPPAAVPLFLGTILLAGLAHRRGRSLRGPLLTVSGSAALACLLWLLPLLSIVGGSRFWALCLAHARGHVSDFGGGLWADAGRTPSLLWGAGLVARLPAIGLAVVRALGPAIVGLALIVPLAMGIAAPLRPKRRSLLPPSLRVQSLALWALTATYIVYVALSTRLLGNGRHLLPVPVAVAAALAVLFAALLRSQAGRAGLLIALALSAIHSTAQIWAFRSDPAPGLKLVSTLPDCRARLYGAAAARFYDLRCGSGSAQPAIYLGEVLSDLERRSNPPAEVLVTSEVIASPASRARLRPLARACVSPSVPSTLRFFGVPSPPPRPLTSAADAGPDTDCVELFAYRVLP